MMYRSIKDLDRYKAISFDIFDTLVVRECGSPEVVFEIVATTALNIYGIKDFKMLRMSAEKYIRSIADGEVTLDEIYTRIAELIGNSDAIQILKDLEIKSELEQCVARKDMMGVYRSLMIDHEVYIVSDMYLPYGVIESILVKNDIPLPKKLYVSCEYNKTKRNRQLYKQMLTDNNLKPRDVIHIGDNFISDYLNPKLLGMNSCWLRK